MGFSESFIKKGKFVAIIFFAIMLNEKLREMISPDDAKINIKQL